MFTTEPKVSIAMASFNGSKYIAEQLDSIINQTYRNIEIIITDDASSDSTVEIILGFQRKYDFIKLFLHRQNRGINSSFENSIRNCSGSFMAISDQDDIWMPDKIEILVNQIKNEDAIYSDSELIDENGNSLNKRIGSLINLRSHYSAVPFIMGIGLPGHTLLLKSDFVKSILPIPQNIMYDRWISFCAAGNNGIKYVDIPLVKYRQHETNCFGAGKSGKSKKQKVKRKNSREKFQNKLMELKTYEELPIINEETKLMLKKTLELFTRKLSFARANFFFRNMNQLLVIKRRTPFRKILYCTKMFFKANY